MAKHPWTLDKNWAKISHEVGSNPPTYNTKLSNQKPRGHTGEEYRLIWRGKIIKSNQGCAVITLETINSKLNQGTAELKDLQGLLEGRGIFKENEFFVD
ncbi:hypothetical protein GOV12_00125 [Candidatus Pacearchaeota archaeon]|nr:hypothetical protein [Candidatus Pacearchaeota archaeon]